MTQTGEQINGHKETFPDSECDHETIPDPIPEDSIAETITSEVVVVGGGIAGISAAISAVETGAGVVLIEKSDTCPVRGVHIGFIGSRLQKKLGIKIDKDEVILNLVKYGANKPDQRLIRMWAEDGGGTMDWLMDMTDAAGLKVSIYQFPPPPALDNTNEYYPQYLVTHEYENGNLVAKCLKDNALDKGVVIHFNTRAEQLLREEKGRVTGIIARNEQGKYVRYNAEKAVVLCTGDYSNNAGMVARYCPQIMYMKSVIPTSTGDGHLMAMRVGAVMEPAPHAPMTHGFAGPLGADAFLQVNINGERFQNEDIPCQSYTNAVERQPGKTAWQVFDSKYPEELPSMGIGLGKIIKMTDKVREAVERKSVIADTIEELAEKMTVPVETFRTTVARYNEMAKMGKDLDFGKRADRLTTIDKPPYYAGKGRYRLLAVMGGLNVNTRLQALDEDREAIPGLYLAGNTMGNRFAVDYPTMTPGISHGMALHFGRIAGYNAATSEPR